MKIILMTIVLLKVKAVITYNQVDNVITPHKVLTVGEGTPGFKYFPRVY